MALQENALCTTDDIESALPEGVTMPDDEVVERYINAASDLIERYCRRVFRAEDDIEESHPAGTRILVKRPPIRAFQNTDTYHVTNATSGVLAKGCCPSPSQRYLAVYDGGFETLPPAIVQACIDMVVNRIATANLDVLGVTSVREGEVTATRQITEAGLLPGVEATLKAYRLART